MMLSLDTSLRISLPPGDPDSDCQTARANLLVEYPGLDFQCHFSRAGFYSNLHLPAAKTDTQVQKIIFDAIDGAIYGPWALNIIG